MPPKRTTSRRYVGQNVRGTPAMSGKKVRHDLREVRKHSDAYGLQEFKWRWYWVALDAIMRSVAWGSYPGHHRGLSNPVYGAQGLGWRRRLWRRVNARVRLLMDSGGLTTKRYLRAVLLQDRKTKIRCWHGSTHFQVSGDGPNAKPLPQHRLHDNIDRLHSFLISLHQTGHPIVFELDANIHHDTGAFKRLQQVVEGFGGTFHGVLGVEYLFTIPGRHGHVVVEKTFTIPTKRLFTDHEGRGIVYHVVQN